MGRPNREVEIKLGVPDAGRLRLKLKILGARVVVPRTYESNTLYDTPSRSLTRHGQLIRIRMERPSPNSRNARSVRAFNAVLTYKGPLNLLRSPKSTQGEAARKTRYKIRKEIEVVVDNPGQMSSILRSLGFRPVFRYEKFRTTYALPGVRGVKVEFDETPVGLYLELEGKAEDIDRAAGRLGYSADQYLTSTYGDIYLAQCRRRKRKPADMLFPPTKKMR